MHPCLVLVKVPSDNIAQDAHKIGGEHVATPFRSLFRREECEHEIVHCMSSFPVQECLLKAMATRVRILLVSRNMFERGATRRVRCKLIDRHLQIVGNERTNRHGDSKPSIC